MKRSAMLIAISLASSSLALAREGEQKALVHPRLPTFVRHASDFVPAGWKLVAVNAGDLGGDRHADVAVLMRKTDPANIRPVKSNPHYKTDDLNPYLLAIGFGRGDGFSLVASNSALFPRETAPIHSEDPPGPKTVEIRRGVLTLTFGHLRGSDTLRFRWNGTAFALIGYDCASVAGGQFSGLSANYLTGKARIERGDVSSDHPHVSTVGIRPGKRPTLQEITWESDDWAGTDLGGSSLGC